MVKCKLCGYDFNHAHVPTPGVRHGMFLYVTRYNVSGHSVGDHNFICTECLRRAAHAYLEFADERIQELNKESADAI